MDFVQEEERRSRNTFVLWTPFLASALVTIPFAYFSLVCGALAFASYLENEKTAHQYTSVVLRQINWTSFAIVTLAVAVLLCLLMTLRRKRVEMSGIGVAKFLNGTPVFHAPTDLKQKELRDVVEEMAIAAQVPAPKICILPYAKGINAFSAGTHPSDWMVGITQGALEQLSRDEIQAVIAHEMGHMVRGDVELDMELMSILFGAYGIYSSGKWLMHLGSDMGTIVGFSVALIGFFVWLAGIPGYLFGRAIVTLMLRQREFLADACAIQWTRQNVGLIHALEKMKQNLYGSRIDHPLIHEVEHLFFGSVANEISFGVFGAHPSVGARLRMIQS